MTPEMNHKMNHAMSIKPVEWKSSLLHSALVIEDDPDLSEAIQIFFDPTTWDVKVAKNLHEAALALKNGKYDLILADYRLPDGLSLNAFGDFRSSCDHFVLMTGDHEVEALAQKLGVENFIGKPFRKCDFQKLLHRFYI